MNYPRSWSEIWIKALTSPNPENYEEILLDPDATTWRACTWIALTTALSFLMILISQLIVIEFTDVETEYQPIKSLVYLPVVAVAGVAGFLIFCGISYMAASLSSDSTGDFDRHTFAIAAYAAPTTLIVGFMGNIPIAGQCVILPLSLYTVYLGVMAIKVAHRFGWMNAVVSFFAVFLVGLAFTCLLGGQVGMY